MKKSVIFTLSILTGGVCGAVAVGKIATEKLNQFQAESDKYQSLFQMMSRWIRIKQSGKKLSSYFEEHGYKKIAVYGVGYVGEALIRELMNSDIEVAYGIDQREAVYTYVDVVTMNGMLPAVDAIVVSAIYYFDEIKEKLSKKVMCPIVSLEEILSSV